VKKLILILSMTLLASQISACNTVHGFGKDLEKVGGKISDKSEKAAK